MRIYQKNRVDTNPEYYQYLKNYVKDWKSEKYNNDAAYKEREKLKSKERYQKNKAIRLQEIDGLSPEAEATIHRYRFIVKLINI